MGAAEKPGIEAAEEPWIETPAGGLFFVNALLVTPAAVALLPLLLGALLRALGLVRGSVFFDVIPAVADHFVPYLGWVAVVPLWTVVRNLRMEMGSRPRVALAAFLVVHACVLTYTFWRWVFGTTV